MRTPEELNAEINRLTYELDKSRDSHVRAIRAERKRAEIAIEALELISHERSYVESQSTGKRYYHDTGGSETARHALAKIDAILSDVTGSNMKELE
jgi:hypothetical protein